MASQPGVVPVKKVNMKSYASGIVVLDKVSFSKELRANVFPVLIKILENPLEELVSTSSPDPQSFTEEQKRDGVVLIYDSRCQDYLQDMLIYKKTKMSVKHVLHNEVNGSYRLKNHKNDKGKPVMRRQTWMEEMTQLSEEGYSWRKHEYKLVVDKTSSKPQKDGSMRARHTSSAQDFPVLIHYFRKNAPTRTAAAGSKPTKRKTRASNKRGANKKRAKVVVSEDDDDPDDEEYVDDDDEAARITRGIDSKRTAYSVQEGASASPSASASASATYADTAAAPGLFGFGGRSDSNIVVKPDSTASIVSFAPDSSAGPCQVIAVVTGFPERPGTSSFVYSCKFGDAQVDCQQLAANTFSFLVPMRYPGVTQFWIARRNVSTQQVEYTNPCTFFSLPTWSEGRLSLAWNQLSEFPQEWVEKFRETVRELDVSFNKLTDISFCGGISLESLILDNNLITSHTAFPLMPKLRSLSLNRNAIKELDPFLDMLAIAAPNLQFLSLLGNEACPLFLGNHNMYNEYQEKVRQKLPNLTHLDSTTIK